MANLNNVIDNATAPAFKTDDIVKVIFIEGKSVSAKSYYVDKEFKVLKVKPAEHPNWQREEFKAVYRLEGCGTLLFAAEELVMIKEKIVTQETKDAIAKLSAQKAKAACVEQASIDKAKSNFKMELDDRCYHYTNGAINTIFKNWFAAKKELIALLSKHPQWDADQMCIHFDSDFSRPLDTDQSNSFMSWLYRNTNVETFEDIDSWGYSQKRLYSFIQALSRCTIMESGIYNEADLEYVNKLDEGFRFRDGMKTTRVIGKIAKKFGWDKDERYRICHDCVSQLEKVVRKEDVNGNGHLVDVTYYVCPNCGKEYKRNEIETWSTEFAKLADALTPLKITRHTCISVNPVDYLLMSNGNSWRSCHYIGDNPSDNGCYSSGTISYMLDETTVIFYTVDGGYNGDYISGRPKIQRQVFSYHDGQLFQSRLYPQSNDYGAKDTYTDIRAICQKVFADCLDMPNLWTKRNGAKNVEHGYGATCYPDWDGQANLCSVSVLKALDDERLDEIVVGAEPICIECGGVHSTEESINCCGSGYYCAECGEYIGSYEDDVYWIDGEPYCGDCVFYCEHCGEYHLIEHTDYEYVRNYGNVCEYCLNRSGHFFQCEECGEWFVTDDMNELDGNTICDKCFNKYAVACVECGEYHYTSEMSHVTDKDGDDAYVCDSCIDEWNERHEVKAED